MSNFNSFPLNSSQYELRKVIGRGATATVYAAKCIANNKEVAIKLINLELCPIEIESLRAEIAFWSSCNHPNVVQYYGSFIEKSYLYIIMEYMNMGSISEIIKFGFHKGIPKESVISAILKGVLSSLAYFHENDQIHRDIKAGNVLVNQKGEIKIGDFGIAANLVEQGQRIRARFTVIGTPCYMAPEVIAAQKGYSEKADIWSLGITALELATGTPPYSNLYPLEVIVRISNSPPPSLPEDGNYSPAFRDFVRMILQKQPEKRPTAAELLNTKFIRQLSATQNEMSDIFGHIPSIEDQYEFIHNASSIENNPAIEISENIKTEWDFSLMDAEPEVEIETSTGDSEGTPTHAAHTHSMPTVVQKGKFTITKSTNACSPPPIPPLPTQASNDKQIISDMKQRMSLMKQKIDSLKNENKTLKNQLEELETEVQQFS